MANSIGLLGLGWVALTGLTSGFVALVEWRARQHAGRQAATLEPGSANLAQPVPRHGDVRMVTFESRRLDVDHAVSGALAQLRDVVLRDEIELSVVVQPGLAVWADPCALLQMLLGIFSQAIERAEGGALLVSASWHGGRTQLTAIDDGPAGDSAVLAGRLREVEQCAALQGGTLEIECRPLRGNKVVLRMPGIGAPAELSSDEYVSDDELTADDEPSAGMAGAA
jgi:hypothetical protein